MAKLKFYLTISLILLVVFCCTINSTWKKSHDWNVPGQFTTGRNIRKTLKECSNQNKQTSSLVLLTILLSNDVQTNPGPRAKYACVFPCGLCDEHVEHSGVACDGCDIWYHRTCASINRADFEKLEDVQWFCHKCDSINCDSFTFRSYSINNSSNFYSPLQNSDISIDSFHSGQNFSPYQMSSPKDVFTQSPTPAQVPPNKNKTHATSTFQTPPRQSPGHHKRTSRNSSNIYDLPKKDSLRVLNINCQSVVRKRAELAALIDYVKPDVVCGTESWLQTDIQSSEIFPDNYTAYRKDRGTMGGGVFILVHRSLVSTALPDLDAECEMIWAKIHMKANRDLLIGCFYMPQRSPNDLKELNKTLQKICHTKVQQQIILAGDFNCPDINWNTNTVPTRASDRQVQEELVDLSIESQLTQIHDQPTRLNNMIDLIFVSNPSLVKFSVSIPGCSDHDAVVSDLDTHPRRVKEKPMKSYLFSKAKWEDISSELEPLADMIASMKRKGAHINTMWEAFKASIMSAVEKHVPSVLRKKRNDLPWIDKTIRKQLKRKKRLFKKAKKSGNWKNYRFHQKECRRKMRKAEQQYINDIIEKGMKDNNTKPFWRYAKARRQDNTGVAPLKDGAKLVSDSASKAKLLLQQFCSVFTRDKGSTLPQIKSPEKPAIGDLTIREEGVAKLLRNLNASKACGPDGIPSKILKNCANTLASPLTCIYNHSLETGNLPSDWLTANVACVFKKGDRNKAENYRPVSLTSVACKMLEHIICHHLREHLEKHNVLTDKNHGFRSGFSCDTQLLTTIHDLLKSNDSGAQTDVIILDFSKAFDTVPHNKLLHKLRHYGVQGTVHQWITNFLTKRTMRVVLEGESSADAVVESGVPQGTVLGPLLFLCHINDLPDTVSSKVRLFADDCLLYREIHSTQDHYALQEDLRKLEAWAKEWGMRFNAKKCFVLPTKSKSTHFYQLGEDILQQVDQNPYLGLTISADLKWATHVTNICKRAGSTLGFLRRNLGKCPFECRRLAYLMLVRSTLEYGATVWDPYLQQDKVRLERVQRQAARFIKRDYRSRDTGCVTRMLQELDLPPLEERRRQQRLTMLYKIIEGKIPALPPQSFLSPMDKTKRKIRAKVPTDFITVNIVTKHTSNNTRGYKVPDSNTEQYKSSFFVKTVAEWNQLREEVVQASSIAAFKTAVSRVAPMAALH